MSTPYFRSSFFAAIMLWTLAAIAMPPADSDPSASARPGAGGNLLSKKINQPNPIDKARIQHRRALQKVRDTMMLEQGSVAAKAALAADATATIVTDRVLVILVEFAGSNTFTWTPGVSLWDPFGKCDSAEYNGNVGNAAASTYMAALYGVTGATNFTYRGPLHNKIERPWSAEDRSGDMIWTPDFNVAYYSNVVGGSGFVFNYTRTNGSAVYEDFTGKSVRNYFQDLSAGRYAMIGDVVGWVQVTNSVWWYGADACPGSRSGVTTSNSGNIPGGGTAKTLVTEALEAVKAANPAFNWAQYDQNGDGVIDRLWIIHAGMGEEDSTLLLDRTDYGEGGLWSHSSSVTPAYQVVPGISAGPYIMMPENCGIGVLAHEAGHNLGADDLYAYNGGDTSAGFWTLMADDWTGYPIGFQPPALDPWHLDGWGWLDPLILAAPTMVTVTVGQASAFSGNSNVYRGVKLLLPDGKSPLGVKPIGSYQWWGGKQDVANAMMTTKNAISIPGGGATLSFRLAYDIEAEWDFLWIQVSSNGGSSWITLTNANTISTHDPGWIGSLYGFPDDLAAAGIGGFTDYNATYPSYGTESFNLDRVAGKQVLLRFWYMTDWGTTYDGPFVDEVLVQSGSVTSFYDNAESGDAAWTYAAPWERNDGNMSFTHALYLQWRNTRTNGGYDSCLGDARWRFGPANSGLLVWYNNDFYTDNEVASYLNDFPGFGPKGRMLVVDSHPEPYRDPYWISYGYTNEGANVASRSQMRDAPFSIAPTTIFTMKWSYVVADTVFTGMPGVSTFDDSLGYYPGAEYSMRGPGQSNLWIWCTKQWDASAVVPSMVKYGIKAPPSFTATTPLRYGASRTSSGGLSASWYSGGLGYGGSTGTPGSVAGQYGWHVRVLSESPTQATLVVWNSIPEPTAGLALAAIALLLRRCRKS